MDAFKEYRFEELYFLTMGLVDELAVRAASYRKKSDAEYDACNFGNAQDQLERAQLLLTASSHCLEAAIEIREAADLL